MDELTSLLHSAVANAEFGDGPRRRVSARRLRSLYSAGERLRIYEKTVCREHALMPLVAHLRERLGAYANEDMELHCGLVGYGVDYVRGIVMRRNFEDIALLLVRAGVLLTPRTAAAKFSGWLDGQPIRYKVVGLVDGVSVEKPLVIEDGIEVRNASRTLPPIPGDAIIARLPSERRAGSAEVSFNVTARPAFFRYEDPLEYGAGRKVSHAWAGGSLSTSMLHDFCEALSLSCNHSVRPVDVWQDDGDTAAFCSGGHSLGWRRIHVTESSVATPLTQERLEDAWEVYQRRRSAEKVKKVKSTLDLSIERWVNSKRHRSSLRDSFIELRIALESVLLGDDQGVVAEKSYRLATRGAWWLGETFDERKAYFHTLRKAYGFASTFVHAGSLKRKKVEEAETTIGQAQDLCRAAILRITRTGAMPDLSDAVLGKGLVHPLDQHR